MFCNKFGKELNLINEEEFVFLWVIDWLLFEYDEEVGCYVFVYYLFILLKEEDILFFEMDFFKVMVEVYDIVLNGYEIGGGLLWIYKKEV